MRNSGHRKGVGRNKSLESLGKDLCRKVNRGYKRLQIDITEHNGEKGITRIKWEMRDLRGMEKQECG